MKIKIALILSAVSIFSLSANAATSFSYNGINYDISTTVTSWAESDTLLKSQFWWGNENLAVSVASQTGPSLIGYDSSVYFLYDYLYVGGYGWEGPFVRYDSDTSNCCYVDPHLQGGSVVMYTPEYSAYNHTFAIATVSSVPVPGAIWLFGSAIVGLYRIRRKDHTL